MEKSKQIATKICQSLKLNDSILEDQVRAISLFMDTKNYNSIKKSAWWIKECLKEYDSEYKIAHSKIIDAIAKSLEYTNHHHLSKKLVIPDYMDMMKSREYKEKIVPSYLLKKVMDIATKKGLEGLLPHNLPDDILMGASIQYESFRKDSDENTISILLTILLIFTNYDGMIIEGKGQVKITSEDLQDKINYFGISVLLEEMRRINVISIPLINMPSAENLFDKNREFSIEVLNPELFKEYTN